MNIIIESVETNNDIHVTPDEIVQHIKKQLSANQEYGVTADQAANRYLNTITDSARMIWESGKKIHAIKLVRTFIPIGLKEAKDFCEFQFGKFTN